MILLRCIYFSKLRDTDTKPISNLVDFLIYGPLKK